MSGRAVGSVCFRDSLQAAGKLANSNANRNRISQLLNIAVEMVTVLSMISQLPPFCCRNLRTRKAYLMESPCGKKCGNDPGVSAITAIFVLALANYSNPLTTFFNFLAEPWRGIGRPPRCACHCRSSQAFTGWTQRKASPGTTGRSRPSGTGPLARQPGDGSRRWKG